MGNKYYLQSADESLVADIKTPVGSGSPLQALVKKTEANQWWSVSRRLGNVFDPKLNPPTPFILVDPPVARDSFGVSGDGFPRGDPGRPIRHALVMNTDPHRDDPRPSDASAHASGVTSTNSCTRRANVSSRRPIRHISCNLSSVVA